MNRYSYFHREKKSNRLHIMWTIRAMLVMAPRGAQATEIADLEQALGEPAANLSPPLLESLRRNATCATALAALVFMHSTYENDTMRIIESIASLSPEYFDAKIAGKRVAISELEGVGIEAVKGQLLADFLRRTEKDSFPAKVSLVFSLLAPSEEFLGGEGFSFDLELFRSYDELRHEATHRPSFMVDSANALAAIDYFHRTYIFLDRMAVWHYGQAQDG